MKLSQHLFCFNSTAWTSQSAVNAGELLGDKPPEPGSFDAKSIAFHRLRRVSALKFERGDGAASVTVRFEGKDTPERLFTGETNIRFQSYPRFDKWRAVFDPDS